MYFEYLWPYLVERFVEYYNNKRYHESLNNVTPSDVYFGKDKKIIERRQRIKRKTLLLRKQLNLTPDNHHFNKNNLALLNTIS